MGLATAGNFQTRSKKLFENSQSTAVAPELRPCVTTGAKIASCS
ncbi:MAG: hypothetical protein BECKG1743E_GA0114224_105561, partial [Candidatus Kentron sp. G]